MTPADLNLRLGAAIRQKRIALGLSQEAVGNRIGVAAQQLQKYEKGTNQVGFVRLVEIAAALNTTAPELVAAALGGLKPAPAGGSDRKTLELLKRLALLTPRQRHGVQLLGRNMVEAV